MEVMEKNSFTPRPPTRRQGDPNIQWTDDWVDPGYVGQKETMPLSILKQLFHLFGSHFTGWGIERNNELKNEGWTDKKETENAIGKWETKDEIENDEREWIETDRVLPFTNNLCHFNTF